ncbi:MAG: hypothetical protein LUC93_14685 [Planctomycetaceae bacterium]|nr:hypothetical protein [Planctomycetaceae bacterium]
MTTQNNLGAGFEDLREKVRLVEEMTATYEKLKDARDKGLPPAEALGVDEEQMETMYAMGFMAYRTKRYLDAQFLFSNLLLLNPRNDRYAFAMGSCLKVMGNYEQALLIFGLAMGLDQVSTQYAYYTAQCAWMSGEKDTAVKLLEETLRRGKSDPEGKAFAEMAQVLLDNIKEGAVAPNQGAKSPTGGNKGNAAETPAKTPPPAAPGGRRRFTV